MPNQTKIGTPWPNYLKIDQCANHQMANAEIAQLIAGRNRWLYEMLIGDSAFSNEAPSVPKNPQGKYGIDNSGPPYGPALRHIFTSINYAEDSADSTQKFSIELSDEPITIPLQFYAKPFSDYTGAPYSQAATVMRIYNGSGSAVNLTADITLNGKTFTFWTLAAGSSGNYHGFINTATTVPIKPGLNIGKIVIDTDQASGVELLAFALGNFEKIRH